MSESMVIAPIWTGEQEDRWWQMQGVVWRDLVERVRGSSAMGVRSSGGRQGLEPALGGCR